LRVVKLILLIFFNSIGDIIIRILICF
jgi:hypothetical protein